MKSRSLNLRNTKGENRVPTLTTQYTMYLLYGNVGTDGHQLSRPQTLSVTCYKSGLMSYVLIRASCQSSHFLSNFIKTLFITGSQARVRQHLVSHNWKVCIGFKTSFVWSSVILIIFYFASPHISHIAELQRNLIY